MAVCVRVSSQSLYLSVNHLQKYNTVVSCLRVRCRVCVRGFGFRLTASMFRALGLRVFLGFRAEGFRVYWVGRLGTRGPDLRFHGRLASFR